MFVNKAVTPNKPHNWMDSSKLQSSWSIGCKDILPQKNILNTYIIVSNLHGHSRISWLLCCLHYYLLLLTKYFSNHLERPFNSAVMAFFQRWEGEIVICLEKFKLKEVFKYTHVLHISAGLCK